MAVRVRNIATKAAVLRRVAQAEHLSAVSGQAVEQGLDVVPRGDVVRESNGGRAGLGGALHVVGQRCLQPKSQHEAVHLEEIDLPGLKDRAPSETIDIEAPGAAKIGNAERDDRDLLHGSRSLLRCLAKCRSESRLPQRKTRLW